MGTNSLFQTLRLDLSSFKDEREKIPDPEASKPEDWDESAPQKIVDDSAEKPSGWLDDEPDMIADPDAVRPEDWDDEMDGEPCLKTKKMFYFVFRRLGARPDQQPGLCGCARVRTVVQANDRESCLQGDFMQTWPAMPLSLCFLILFFRENGLRQ